MRPMLSYQRWDDVLTGDDDWSGLDTEADYPLLRRRPNRMLVSILLVYGALLIAIGYLLFN